MDATYHELERRWKALRGDGRVRLREVACVNAARTLLCAEIGDGANPTIALSAGVHGDEPAGPWALLELVESRSLDEAFDYRIWPCLNPSGFFAGTRENAEGADVNRSFGRGGQTPEARAVVTANRDRRFALSIDLHEDSDADGFYCYRYGGERVARAAIAAIRDRGFPIQALDRYDLGIPIDESLLRRADGIVEPDPGAEAQALGAMSYSIAVARRASKHALTFETPSKLAWQRRVAMHCAATRAAIGAMARPPLE